MTRRTADSVMSMLTTLGNTIARGSRFMSWTADEGLKMRVKGQPSTEAGVDIMLALAGHWVQSGAPTIALSPQRLQRMLEAQPRTRPRSPWPAWALVLPETEAMSLIDTDGQPDCIQLVFAVHVDDHWAYVMLGGHVEYIDIGISTEDMLDAARMPTALEALEPHAFPLTAHDRVTCQRIRHLILMASLGVQDVRGITRLGYERPAQLKGIVPAGDYLLTDPGLYTDPGEADDHVRP